ncbi:THO complex subunit 2 [Aphanomyces cochlioides]|nr:THO complex subunit 2 [Aphanomyces cochlioides]KAG9400281.1 THO complex subunit 2 [Aphanomyces cochlioides]KAG9400284.1 THO complex subunit 2 [Aphanomyces cochlioides]
MSVVDNLVNEKKDQVAHRKAVFARLEEYKEKFFGPEKESTVSELLQKCIIPRSLLSPEDALYCAKFMHNLHPIGVPKLNTLQYYQNVTLNLSGLVLCTTELEASNFGIFFRETHVHLSQWYQYEEEYKAHGKKAGFSVSLTDPTNVLSYTKYNNLYIRWQNHQ